MDLSTLWTNILRLLAYDPTSPMIFSSGTFWALFLLFLPIYAKLKGRRMDMVVYGVAEMSPSITISSLTTAVVIRVLIILVCIGRTICSNTEELLTS